MDTVKGSDGDLGKQLAEHMRQTGKLSSASVQAAIQDAKQEPKETADQVIHKETAVDTDEVKTDDPLIKAGGTDNIGDVLKEMETIKKLKRAQLVITPEDKEAFITSIISGARLVLSFTRLGERFHISIRSRTVPETQAIFQALKHEIDDAKLITQTDYTIRLRSMMLAAQVVTLNGIDNVTLATPLNRTIDSIGKTVEPAWLGQANHWNGISEGVQSIAWECLNEFEDKYWMMVEDAKNANFWNPAAST